MSRFGFELESRLTVNIRRIHGLLIVLILSVHSAWADAAPVPISLQVPILFKILSLDKNLTRRAGETISVGVIYDSRDKNSSRERSEFKESVGQDKKLAGKDIVIQEFDAASGGSLAEFSSRHSISILYATTGVEKLTEEMIRIARDQKVTTAASSLSYVEKGFSVSFEVEDNKPRIVINHDASKDEGCSFSAQVLKVARIVK